MGSRANPIGVNETTFEQDWTFRPGGFQAANLKKRTFETDGSERAEIDGIADV